MFVVKMVSAMGTSKWRPASELSPTAGTFGLHCRKNIDIETSLVIVFLSSNFGFHLNTSSCCSFSSHPIRFRLDANSYFHIRFTARDLLRRFDIHLVPDSPSDRSINFDSSPSQPAFYSGICLFEAVEIVVQIK